MKITPVFTFEAAHHLYRRVDLSTLRGYMRRTGQVPTAIVGQRKQA